MVGEVFVDDQLPLMTVANFYRCFDTPDLFYFCLMQLLWHEYNWWQHLKSDLRQFFSSLFFPLSWKVDIRKETKNTLEQMFVLKISEACWNCWLLPVNGWVPHTWRHRDSSEAGDSFNRSFPCWEAGILKSEEKFFSDENNLN